MLLRREEWRYATGSAAGAATGRSFSSQLHVLPTAISPAAAQAPVAAHGREEGLALGVGQFGDGHTDGVEQFQKSLFSLTAHGVIHVACVERGGRVVGGEIAAPDNRQLGKLRTNFPAACHRANRLGTWHHGAVKTLSQSGIFLVGAMQLPENTLVEMVFEMPEEISGQRNSTVLCQGRILRRQKIRDSESLGSAASILNYKFLRQN